jgi:hypothetical protein
MGIRDFFRKDKKKEPDPLKDLSLSELKVGYLLDYDLKTWEVTAYNYYDWGGGDISHEWQLRSGDEVVYLEKESGDEEEWSLNRKIAFASLGSGLKEQIIENGDPPEEMVFEGTAFTMEEMAGGHFHQDGQGPGKELLRWSYEDDEGRRYLGVEQWGEEDFDATVGEPVEEYQFTNILPRERT